MNKKLSEELIKEIQNYYVSNIVSIKTLSKKYAISTVTLSKVLKNIPKHSKVELKNPMFNENFFETIDSEEKAYFLGFIIADGNVFDYNSNTQKAISITQSTKDKYILEKFKDSVKTNASISELKDGTSCIAVHSNKMAEDLAKYGVVPNKSYFTYLAINNIKKEYIHHVIRGIFDGDGSIFITPYKTWYHKSVDISGSYKLISDISSYLFTNVGLNVKPKVNVSKKSTLSYLRLQSIHDIYMFGEWMYEDATIYLTRKFDRYKKFKEIYNLKNDNTELTN